MNDALTDLLRPARPTAIVDVGANPIDGRPPYRAMLARGICTLVGFEPQPAALARLNAAKGPNETYLPDVVGDGTSAVLRICASEGMTSLLEPDPAHLALFNMFPIWGAVKDTVPVPTTRLDDIGAITAMDFLKMDIQGGEMAVLEHGRAKLQDTVAIQTEMSFVPLYQGQPGFGVMDVKLRAMGFLPHCFAEMKIWPLAPMVVDNEPRKGLRQLLEGDMVYVRDFTKAQNMNAEQWKHLALIAHHCYGSADLALRCVTMAAELDSAPKDAPARYLDILKQKSSN